MYIHILTYTHTHTHLQEEFAETGEQGWGPGQYGTFAADKGQELTPKGKQVRTPTGKGKTPSKDDETVDGQTEEMV